MKDVDRFLGELAVIPDVTVSKAKRVDSTVSASVRYGSVQATLVCNAFSGPATYGKNQSPEFGAFVLVEDGYGDHIKGFDAPECACYTIGWLAIRSLAREPAGAAPMLLRLDRYQSDDRGGFPQLAEEIWLRAGALATPAADGFRVQRSGFVLDVAVEPSGLSVRSNSQPSALWVPRLPAGLLSAVVAGILDGLDDESDE